MEDKLKKLGKTVNELAVQARNLQKLFNNVLEDFKNENNNESKNKKQKRRRRTNTNNKNKIKGTPINTQEKRESISSSSEHIIPSMTEVSYFSVLTNSDHENAEHNSEGNSKSEEYSPLYKSIKKRKFPEFNNQEEPSINSTKSKSKKPNKKKSINSRHPLQRTQIFSAFTKDEKERIIYDKINLGIRKCERKWGVNHRNMDLYIKQSELFKNELERDRWMSKQQEIIQNKLNKLEKSKVIKNTENALNLCKITPNPGLDGLRTLSFDRGLAIAGAKYSVNLFELEFALLTLYPSEWLEMEENEWYLGNFSRGKGNKPPQISKLEVFKLYKEQGIHYASKRTGKTSKTIYSIIKYIEEEHMCESQDEDGDSMKEIDGDSTLI